MYLIYLSTYTYIYIYIYIYILYKLVLKELVVNVVVPTRVTLCTLIVAGSYCCAQSWQGRFPSPVGETGKNLQGEGGEKSKTL